MHILTSNSISLQWNSIDPYNFKCWNLKPVFLNPITILESLILFVCLAVFFLPIENKNLAFHILTTFVCYILLGKTSVRYYKGPQSLFSIYISGPLIQLVCMLWIPRSNKFYTPEMQHSVEVLLVDIYVKSWARYYFLHCHTSLGPTMDVDNQNEFSDLLGSGKSGQKKLRMIVYPSSHPSHNPR